MKVILTWLIIVSAPNAVTIETRMYQTEVGSMEVCLVAAAELEKNLEEQGYENFAVLCE